jgi:hypothetical protein
MAEPSLQRSSLYNLQAMPHTTVIHSFQESGTDFLYRSTTSGVLGKSSRLPTKRMPSGREAAHADRALLRAAFRRAAAAALPSAEGTFSMASARARRSRRSRSCAAVAAASLGGPLGSGGAALGSAGPHRASSCFRSSAAACRHVDSGAQMSYQLDEELSLCAGHADQLQMTARCYLHSSTVYKLLDYLLPQVRDERHALSLKPQALPDYPAAVPAAELRAL